MQNAKYIEVSAAVRYWEDARVDGVTDSGGDIPLRDGELWKPVINLETGAVKDWPLGVTAEVHYKVCDEGEYWLQDEQGQRIAKWKGCYVPNAILCPKGNGYGDYIIFNIGASSQIENWRQPGIDAEQWETIDAEHSLSAQDEVLTKERIIPNLRAWDIIQEVQGLQVLRDRNTAIVIETAAEAGDVARAILAAAASSPAVAMGPSESNSAAPPLPLEMDTAEKISLSTVDCPELLEKLGAYAAEPNLDTAWAVLQCADRRLHHIIGRRFEIARGEPIAHLRFRAAQQWSGVGGHDIEHAEWFETCHAHEVGDDKQPAFPVYAATPSPSLAVRDVVEDQTQRQRVARAIWNLRREDEDRCDMELEDMGDQHSVWEEADAAIAAMPKPNADCSGEPANCPDNEGLGCACDPMNKTAKETSNGN